MVRINKPPAIVIEIATPVRAPHWALLERELMRAIETAVPAFYSKYFDERGYLDCFVRWGALDGPDDAAENVTNWTDFYALGGSEEVLALYRGGIEGHIKQYTEARTAVTTLGRDGMYYKEFPTSFDWVHNGEGYHCLFQQGLCQPWDARWQQRIKRFAGFYLPGDKDEPAEPNYDPEHKLIRSALNGSRGPVLGRAELVDWAGDPFEVAGRFSPGRGHRSFDDYLFHFETYRNVEGDIPLNMASTAMAFYAYAATGDARYREWIEEYSSAWAQRTYQNDGLIPGNVGLDGVVGSGFDGKWWEGVYGWGHTGGFYGLDEKGKPIPHHRPNFQGRTPYAFGNALLVSGDQKYVDAWRSNITTINEQHAKEEGGQALYPRMYNDDGWYDWQPQPFDKGALAVWFWSQDAGDRHLVATDPWVRFLGGDNESYPVETLQDDLEQVRQKVDLRATDTTTADTRLSEDPNGINPAVVWGLVQLMNGGLPTRHLGIPWHCRVRYFDADRRRAGLPPGVASLVDGMSDTETTVQLVNLDPVEPCTLVVQAGAYAEHSIETVAIDENRPVEVGGATVNVRLAPGAGARLTLTGKRFCNQPTVSFPWPT